MYADGLGIPSKLICAGVPTDVAEGMELVSDFRNSLGRIVSL